MYISYIRVCSIINCPSIYIYIYIYICVCVLWFSTLNRRIQWVWGSKKNEQPKANPDPCFFDLHGVVLIRRSEVCGKSLLFTRVSKDVFDISGMGYK